MPLPLSFRGRENAARLGGPPSGNDRRSVIQAIPLPGYGVEPARAGSRATAPAPTGKPASPSDCPASGAWPSSRTWEAQPSVLGLQGGPVVTFPLGDRREAPGERGQSDPPLSTGRTCGKPARKPAHCKRQVFHRRRARHAHGGTVGKGGCSGCWPGASRAGFRGSHSGGGCCQASPMSAASGGLEGGR